MNEFLVYTIGGLVTAAIYAIAASGLVVTYTTSGVFNIAHGAVGMFGAFVFWQLRWGWCRRRRRCSRSRILLRPRGGGETENQRAGAGQHRATRKDGPDLAHPASPLCAVLMMCWAR